LSKKRKQEPPINVASLAERERIKKIMAKPIKPKATAWYWRVKNTEADVSDLQY